MKTPLLRQPLRFFTLLMAVALLGTSCSKDKDDKKDSGFPRTVTVEYKITSSTGLNAADVDFTNETMGMSTIDNAAVPFTKKMDLKLTEPAGIALSATSTVGGSLKLEIFVNGKSVQTQTFSGTSIVHGVLPHYFQN